MKVYLEGLNGCLSKVVHNVGAIMLHGDKIHISYNYDDSIIKGSTFNRANYCICGVFEEDNHETAI